MARILLLSTLLLVSALGLVSRAQAIAPAANGAAPAGMPLVVPVGKGSYAAFPPAEAGKQAREIDARPLQLLPGNKRPVPTNQWWTNLLLDKYVGQLWAFPLMVKGDPEGANLFFPTKWNDEGRDPISDFPIEIRGDGFKPADTRAKEWGDWTLTFRAAESAAKYMDVTLGRGLPYAWVEFHGVAPRLRLGGSAVFFTRGGASAQLPVTGDQLGVDYGGRSYALFAPDGTRFSQEGDRIAVRFTAPNGYLVFCPLPVRKDLDRFAPYAYAIPRDSRMTWAYDAAAGKVTTTWKLTTEPLKGTEHRLIQGWLPHHLRKTTPEFQLNGLEYLTPRGTLSCAVGTEFHISYPFHGFLPSLPAPRPQGLPHDFSAERMQGYLARYATRTEYANDTYWGGKSVTQLAQYMWMASELRDPAAARLRSTLRTALVDWFTYTPGEKAHFFARYPNWHALIGFQTSYGSEAFNDQHFHLGYFTTAAALLGMQDPQFLQDYGGMARLAAKQYANWDRTDAEFPFLRTFDIWEGHSWAGGYSSPTGNNQESSSEAMQSWGGLFLLGAALGDREMTAAGAMGYAMESQAVHEYWFNRYGGNFSPNYKHPIAGMVWSGGLLYGTYFSGDPAWIFGIQWLPMSPALSYLVEDPEFARKSFRTMLAERKAKEGKDSIASMGPALGNVVLAHAQQFDPDWAAEQLDQLWDAKDPVALDNDTPGLTYYLTHAGRSLGAIQWEYHTSLPTSCVYRNARTQAMSYVVFNPESAPRTVDVYRGVQKVGTLSVPARTLLRAEKLQPPSTAAPAKAGGASKK